MTKEGWCCFFDVFAHIEQLLSVTFVKFSHLSSKRNLHQTRISSAFSASGQHALRSFTFHFVPTNAGIRKYISSLFTHKRISWKCPIRCERWRHDWTSETCGEVGKSDARPCKWTVACELAGRCQNRPPSREFSPQAILQKREGLLERVLVPWEIWQVRPAHRERRGPSRKVSRAYVLSGKNCVY